MIVSLNNPPIGETKFKEQIQPVIQAHRHLTTLFGQVSKSLYFAISSKAAKGRMETEWFPVSDRAGATRFGVERAEGDVDVYVRLCPTDRPHRLRGKATDSVALPALWLDVDFNKGKSHLDEQTIVDTVGLAVGHAPTMVVQSGHGLHLYWVLVKPVTDMGDAEALLRRFKATALNRLAGYGIDPQVFDLARVFRLAGTTNYKAEPVPVELIQVDNEQLYDVEDIADRLMDCQSRLNVTESNLSVQEPSVSFLSVSPHSVSSNSVTSIEELTLRTVPKRAGQRNRRIFDFARGLKHNLRFKNLSDPRLKQAVHRWHEEAVKNGASTHDPEETWKDFRVAWKNANHPIGDLAQIAFETAKRRVIPACAYQYRSTDQRMLVAMCRELQVIRGKESDFSLSVSQVARLLWGEHPDSRIWASRRRTAHRWLGRLCKDKVLAKVKSGKPGYSGRKDSAARFRYRVLLDE